MSAVGIIVAIFFIVLVLYVMRSVFYNANTLSSTQNGQTATTIQATSLPTTSTGAAPTNFTYSMWFFIDNWNYRFGQPKVIIGRMGSKSSSGDGADSGIKGLFGASPCPVVALGANENTLTCALTCFSGLTAGSTATTAADGTTTSTTNSSNHTVHTCMIANIPLQSWVNAVIVVNGQTLEMYLNGKLVRTCPMPGTAVVDNSAPLEVTPGGGFEGYTANIQYWPEPKNQQEVWNIYTKGYKNNILGNMFSTYSVQLSVTENGVTQGSVTI